MFSCPQPGRVTHFCSVYVPDFLPLFSLLSMFCCTPPVFGVSVRCVFCFYNQVNKWGNSSTDFMSVRPTATLIVWCAEAKTWYRRACLCVGGVLALRRCDCGSQTGGICSLAAIEGVEEICCWGCGYESKSSWIPQLCLPVPSLTSLVPVISTCLKKLHFIDYISCEASQPTISKA